MFIPKSYKKDHPNPSFFREDYLVLDGLWDFKFDKFNLGEILGYKRKFRKDYDILVPYPFEALKSGIGIIKNIHNVWYRRIINIDSLDKDVFLHLEGIDYKSKVYVNNRFVGCERGGYHRHTFNITKYLKVGENKLVIKAHDDKSILKPRGKQRFTKDNWECWYEEVNGIYKSVWIEYVAKRHIEYFKLTPSFKNKNIKIELDANDVIDSLNVKISYKDIVLFDDNISSNNSHIEKTYDLSKEFHAWDVLKPELYDIEFNYESDKVLSYFGVRDIEIKGNKIYLNDKELYQKLVLDQGYIEGGHYTLTSDELLFDIESMIKMGFNGARKHQKRESDIFYSYSDFLGYLVWLEMPSFYLFTILSSTRHKREWLKIIKELYNHPSIITYTPFNESWGMFGLDKGYRRQINFANKIHDQTKSFDNTRLILTNDGWSHANSDFLTLHLYNQDIESFKYDIDRAINLNFVNYKDGRKFVIDNNLNNKPILLDEFGGTAFMNDNSKNWGYGKRVKDLEEYKERLKELFGVILKDDRFSGYCYTQLSDVRQEINGLYTMDRKPKISDEDMIKIQNQ